MPKTNAKTNKKSNAAKAKAPTITIKPKARSRLPSVWQLSQSSLKLLYKNWRLFGGILLIYGAINFILAQGLSSGLNVDTIKHQLSGVFHGNYASLGGGVTIYALMLTSFGSGNTSSGLGYSLLTGIVASLAVIWAIRNVLNDKKVRIRDAYYRGLYPIVPFILIFSLIAIELVPMLIGISLYVIAVNNTIAVTIIEKAGFLLLMLLLAAASLFLVSSSIFALYISTLPDMTPVKALRSARNLVKGRRWIIMPRLLYLPVALLITTALIMVPVIIFAAPIAPWLFMLVSLIMLAIVNAYLYNFYRELLE